MRAIEILGDLRYYYYNKCHVRKKGHNLLYNVLENNQQQGENYDCRRKA
jgi:hypothetical protein